MRVEEVSDIVVGAVVQLLNCGLLTMLVRQPLPVRLMALSQRVISDLLDAHHARHSIVEGG